MHANSYYPRSARKAKRITTPKRFTFNNVTHHAVDQIITGFDGMQSFDGDAVYYRTNVIDPDFQFDDFNDIDNEYALLTLSDSPDGQIEDEDDEMQNAYLCELECGYL